MSSLRPSKCAYVVYRTRRFEQMLRWYETVFDAKVQDQTPALACLTYDDKHHRFALLNLSLLQPDGTETDYRGLIGVDHVAYTYASLNDLLQNYAQLKKQGILPYWCVHHGKTVSMYYADPDGNQMAFQVDSFTSSQEANAFIESHFSVNPIGVEYDPEDWLARLRAACRFPGWPDRRTGVADTRFVGKLDPGLRSYEWTPASLRRSPAFAVWIAEPPCAAPAMFLRKSRNAIADSGD